MSEVPLYRSLVARAAFSIPTSPRYDIQSGSYMKCVSIKKISGNEVYSTIVLILFVKIMMCSELHC